MKRRVVRQCEESLVLFARARIVISDNAARQTLISHNNSRRADTPVLSLAKEEGWLDAGRFERFSKTPLKYQARVSIALPTVINNYRSYVHDQNRNRLAEYIDWIIEQDTRWSFDVIAEMEHLRSQAKDVRSYCVFTFDNQLVATKFALQFA